MTLLCLGLNHRTTPLEHREAFAISGEAARSALAAIGAHAAVDEVALLSTCNRMEWYVAASQGDEAIAELRRFLQNYTGYLPRQLDLYLYRLADADAVEHLLRVATGLDSMILGEPQILGQVRSAYDLALETQTSGPQLAELFRTAIQTGKQARTETAISRNATSIGSVTMRWITGHDAWRNSQRVAIVGAGEMGALVAQHASKSGSAEIRILNRTLSRAQTLARTLGATAHPLSALPETLAWADAVIAAAGAPEPLITPDMLPHARPTPLLLVDLGVPRAIEPSVAQHPGVQLFVLDDLKQVVQHNLAQRRAAVPQVETMIAASVQAYMAWLGGREVLPVLVGMRRRANDLARAELEQALRKLPTDDPAVADQMSRLAHRLVNKLLHQPTIRLKAQAAQGNAQSYAQALYDLFVLEDTPS
jgi:glutamyl-tRNA reductase